MSVIAISSGSHMVGPSKNSSSQISRTNARMHANVDIWEIAQIKGLRVMKKANQMKIRMEGVIWTKAAMWKKGLVARTSATMELAVTTAGLVARNSAAMELAVTTARLVAEMTILRTTRRTRTRRTRTTRAGTEGAEARRLPLMTTLRVTVCISGVDLRYT